MKLDEIMPGQAVTLSHFGVDFKTIGFVVPWTVARVPKRRQVLVFWLAVRHQGNSPVSIHDHCQLRLLFPSEADLQNYKAQGEALGVWQELCDRLAEKPIDWQALEKARMAAWLTDRQAVQADQIRAKKAEQDWRLFSYDLAGSTPRTYPAVEAAFEGAGLDFGTFASIAWARETQGASQVIYTSPQPPKQPTQPETPEQTETAVEAVESPITEPAQTQPKTSRWADLVAWTEWSATHDPEDWVGQLNARYAPARPVVQAPKPLSRWAAAMIATDRKALSWLK